MNCPKIASTAREWIDIHSILKGCSTYKVENVDSTDPTKIFVTNDTIKAVWSSNKELLPDKYFFKIVKVNKIDTKIFFNDVENELNEKLK